MFHEMPRKSKAKKSTNIMIANCNKDINQLFFFFPKSKQKPLWNLQIKLAFLPAIVTQGAIDVQNSCFNRQYLPLPRTTNHLVLDIFTFHLVNFQLTSSFVVLNPILLCGTQLKKNYKK